MKNFSRAVRLVLRRPLLLALSVICSFLVAVLWGGNITALYPIVEVTFQGRSLQQWAADEIRSGRQNIQRLEEQIQTKTKDLAQLAMGQTELTDNQRQTRQSEISALQSRLQAERRAVNLASKWKPALDRYLPHDPFRTVVLFVVILLAATALKNVFVVANEWLTAKVVQRVMDDLRQKLFDHVLLMDAPTFEKRGANKLATTCQHGVRLVGMGLRSLCGGAVREPLKMLACICGAAFICWRLLVIAALLAPLAILLAALLARRIRGTTDHSLDEDVGLNFVALEAFNGLQTVQSYTMEPAERSRFHRGCLHAARRRLQIALLKAMAKPLAELVGIAAVGLAVISGAYLVLNQETDLLGIRICDRPLSLPALLIFYGLLMGMHDPARKLSDVFASIQVGCSAADRVYRILDTPSRVLSPLQPRPLPQKFCGPHQSLALENVSFGFQPKRPILKNVDLRIIQGETLAVVGPNGCGKSTLAGLLPRFYDPTRGRVVWDGVDLREVDLTELRRRIALVTQKTVLFDDTVFNNIRYGSPQAAEQQIIEAAHQAKIHQVIEEELEQGYHTVVGQNGCRLSSGQRQRIVLARAILRDPELLILDEATSQVDLQSERLIQQALEPFLNRRTTILITHRPSMLALADRIVILDDGRIADMGSHEQLLSRSAFYRSLQNHKLRKTG